MSSLIAISYLVHIDTALAKVVLRIFLVEGSLQLQQSEGLILVPEATLVASEGGLGVQLEVLPLHLLGLDFSHFGLSVW